MGRQAKSRKGERRRGGMWRRGRGRRIGGQRAHWDTIEHTTHFTRQCHSHRYIMRQINYRVRVVMLGHHGLHSRHQ